MRTTLLLVQPSYADDIRRACAKDFWRDCYRAYRRVRPNENLTPRQIVAKFSEDLYIPGVLRILSGVSFYDAPF